MVRQTAIVGLVSGAFVAMLGLAGCQSSSPAATKLQDEPAKATTQPPAPPERAAPLSEDPGATSPRPVRRAIAVMRPMRGQRTMGTIAFTESENGVKVEAEVNNLPPGKHAYHVHLYGDCSSPDGKSAGPHFNFRGPSKNPPASVDYITGDLGELQASKGVARAAVVIEDATLQGPFSLLGRSVVIHEKGNDPSQPPEGGAGDRIACGVIGIDEGG